MKILKSLNDLQGEKDQIALAIGNFDGFHLGHRKLLKELSDQAKNLNFKKALLTFSPHPREVIENKNIEKIYSDSESIEIFKSFNFDYLIFQKFDSNFINLSPEEFLNNWLFRNNSVHHIFVGFNFRFGKNGAGNVSLLKKICEEKKIGLTDLEPIYFDNKLISSSRIRSLMLAGQISQANKLLGLNYSCKGEVIRGKNLGKDLGFPTANIKMRSSSPLAKGVYASKIYLFEEIYFAVTNLGYAPTIQDKADLRAESHLFDFDRDIYGQNINVEFVDFLRSEKKFNNISELKNQIEQDVSLAHKILNLNK